MCLVYPTLLCSVIQNIDSSAIADPGQCRYLMNNDNWLSVADYVMKCFSFSCGHWNWLLLWRNTCLCSMCALHSYYISERLSGVESCYEIFWEWNIRLRTFEVSFQSEYTPNVYLDVPIYRQNYFASPWPSGCNEGRERWILGFQNLWWNKEERRDTRCGSLNTDV